MTMQIPPPPVFLATFPHDTLVTAFVDCATSVNEEHVHPESQPILQGLKDWFPDNSEVSLMQWVTDQLDDFLFE